MAFEEVGDLAVHYQWDGPAAGPVLLLIHSLGTSLHVWDPLLPHLTGRFRVLRYDLRGHGLTEGGIDPAAPATTIDALARDALGLLDRLGVDRVLICGLSIGGMVALRLAALAPGRVPRLVLCSTGHRIGTPEAWDARVAAVAAQGLAGMADAILARWVTESFRARRKAAWRGLRAMLLGTPVAGYAACCRALQAADLEADARAIRCPTLVVAGAQDLATPPAVAGALGAAIPGARVLVLEEAAHLPGVELPALLARQVQGFLDPDDAGDTAYERGLAVRQAVLGQAHVARALARATPFDADFQRHITEHAWGAVWTRPGLDRQARSLLTIGLLAALGHHDELALHIRATRQTGVTRDQVKEVLLHAAVYAGVPAINTAFRLARQVYESLDEEETP